MKFKIGDRVRITRKLLSSCLSVGSLGTIVHLHSKAGSYGVAWDNLTFGHDCNGTCKLGKGYYVCTDDILLDQIFVVDESGEYSMKEPL